ncbi:hypothetical protein MUK42_33366 [Musa troglodytarum]|uniref:Uncharacterized protein n=1 Tax=Musa troglodytarum TaxID=320322 RepID=A0A9E7GCT5_9LILI|nr:hypothetical protein MUK42_33366 [Musa troglodytarum]
MPVCRGFVKWFQRMTWDSLCSTTIDLQLFQVQVVVRAGFPVGLPLTLARLQSKPAIARCSRESTTAGVAVLVAVVVVVVVVDALVTRSSSVPSSANALRNVSDLGGSERRLVVAQLRLKDARKSFDEMLIKRAWAAWNRVRIT